MIPKIIHYCWISGEPFPPLVEKCIESWKTYMPDYQLELWDRERCLSLNIKFVADAIKRHKYAFAADVVRCFALYNYGGIYLDSDILLKKSLDPLLTSRYVTFMEVYPENGQRKIWYNKSGEIIRINGIAVQAAVMASEKGHPFLADVIDYYSGQRFNFMTKRFFMDFVATVIQTQKLLKYGFRFVDEKQTLENDITIYPSSLFESSQEQIMPESYGTHLCLGGWRPKESHHLYRIKRFAYVILKFLKLI